RARFHVGIRLVRTRALLTKTLPRIAWTRLVLRGSIAEKLIVEPRVLRSHIEAFRGIAANAETHTDEAFERTGIVSRISLPARSGNIDLDDAISEVAAGQNGNHLLVRCLLLTCERRNFQRAPSTIVHPLHARIDRRELCCLVERNRRLR